MIVVGSAILTASLLWSWFHLMETEPPKLVPQSKVAVEVASAPELPISPDAALLSDAQTLVVSKDAGPDTSAQTQVDANLGVEKPSPKAVILTDKEKRNQTRRKRVISKVKTATSNPAPRASSALRKLKPISQKKPAATKAADKSKTGALTTSNQRAVKVEVRDLGIPDGVASDSIQADAALPPEPKQIPKPKITLLNATLKLTSRAEKLGPNAFVISAEGDLFKTTVDGIKVYLRLSAPRGRFLLSVQTQPWTTVSVGDKSLGGTPLAAFPLGSGVHQIHLKPEKGAPISLRLRLSR